jgi:hypothetical protein
LGTLANIWYENYNAAGSTKRKVALELTYDTSCAIQIDISNISGSLETPTENNTTVPIYLTEVLGYLRLPVLAPLQPQATIDDKQPLTVTTLRNVTLFALEATIQYCRVSIQNKLRLGTATHWHCAPTSLR